MTTVNLDDLSIEELGKLQKEIDERVERKKIDELLALRKVVDDLIDDSPFTLEEVLEAKALKKPISPKYRNPADASQTWTGRGRKPLWVVEHLENGGELADISV